MDDGQHVRVVRHAVPLAIAVSYYGNARQRQPYVLDAMHEGQLR